MQAPINTITTFQEFIWDYYRKNGRAFAWRNCNNPYYVLVSEIMLQQTQTKRVIEKYQEFITTFPTIEALASASLRDVIMVWQGLGYYRRARYLHQIAEIVVTQHAGIIPSDPAILQTSPGLGAATAASICAFAYNIPTVFIETNIRTVFIHYFFKEHQAVTDKMIMPLVAESVDATNPREWYYALMDYGVFLKSEYTNPSRKSAHYAKQTRFEGSDRQIRAAVLKCIAERSIVTHEEIFSFVNKETERITKIISQLVQEQFIIHTNNTYSIR